jgi:hypothetical protein
VGVEKVFVKQDFERGSQNDEKALPSDFGGMAAPPRGLVPSRN